MQLQISWSIIKEIHVQYLWLCMHYFKFFEDKKPYQCDLCDYNSIYTRTFKIHHARFACASSDFLERASKLHTTQVLKHGECRFVLLAMMLCLPNVIIFPYKKENILGKKLYVLNSGTTTFDEIESIGSKCTFGNHLKPGLSRPGGPKQWDPRSAFQIPRPQVYSSNTETLGLQHKYWDPRSTFQLLRPQVSAIEM